MNTTLFNPFLLCLEEADPGGSGTILGSAGGTHQAVTPLPATETKLSVGEDGSLPEGWYKSLGEGNEGLAKFKNIQDVVKSYAGLEKLASGKLPNYPTAESTPEQIAAFHELTGVPKGIEGYNLKAPQDLPEGMTWDEDVVKAYAEAAHKAHMPKEAFEAMKAVQIKIEGERMQLEEAGRIKQLQDDSASLKKEWGNDFQAKLETSKKVFSRIVQSAGLDVKSPDVIELQNSISFIKMLHAMSKTMLEDSALTSAGGAGQTFSGGRERALDIIKNPDNPFHKRYHDGDEDVSVMVRAGLSGK
ncbi:MAG: hypothetical protein RR506_06525 [Akkermansia sp.]